MAERTSTTDFVQIDEAEKQRLYMEEYQDIGHQIQLDGTKNSPRRPTAKTIARVRSWLRKRWHHAGWVCATILALCLLLRFGNITQLAVAPLQSLSPTEPQNWEAIDTIFFFGDSYTSSVMSDLEKIPMRRMKRLEINNTGVYLRKPQWVNFLTEVYNRTAVTSYNFAMGGSTVDSNVVKPFMAGTSFMDQLRDWKRLYGGDQKQAPWNPKTTLIVAWFGVNDIALEHGRSKEALNSFRRPNLPEVFASYTRSVNVMYDLGARNFLFLTCPPIDLSHKLAPPTKFLMQDKFDETTDVNRFNARLYEMRDSLRSNYTDINTAIFDAHRFWSRVIETPQEYPQTAEVIEPNAICTESALKDMPVNGNYANNTCKDGLLIRQHMWTDMHATYPIHNATAWKVVEDCMGPTGPRYYCS